MDGDYQALLDLENNPATLRSARTLPAPPVLGGTTNNDVDAWFYDDGCSLIRPNAHPAAYHMATIGSIENGVIPTGARFVVVDLARGFKAPFTFTVYPEPTKS